MTSDHALFLLSADSLVVGDRVGRSDLSAGSLQTWSAVCFSADIPTLTSQLYLRVIDFSREKNALPSWKTALFGVLEQA